MISGVVLSRDGEGRVGMVVGSLLRFCGEVVVVVDERTVDGTDEEARAAGARVMRMGFEGGLVDCARNRAAAEARGEWVMMLDDDEVAPRRLAVLAERFVEGAVGRGIYEFVLPRKHLVRDGSGAVGWIDCEPWWPDGQVRLRHRAAWAARPWPCRVHGSPEPWGRAVVSEWGAIWHLKFLVASAAERRARLAMWEGFGEWAKAPHYRKFSVPEEYGWTARLLAPEERGELEEMVVWGGGDGG